MSDRISVILISHDRWPLTKNAVESVLSQTHKNFELIVADDNSKNPFLKEYLSFLDKKRYAKVFYAPKYSSDFRKKHKMVAVMINSVQHLITGDFVSYLGDDNFYFPNRLGVYYRSLMETGSDVVVGEVRWIMKSGARREQDFVTYAYPEPLLMGHNELCKSIAPSNFICNDSVLHRRVGLEWPVDNGNPPVDWRFWLALYNMGFKFKKIKYIGEEAFFPGLWREGLTVKQALTCVEGVMNKKRVVYVKNISKQVQKVKPDGINEIRIAPGERIEWEKASYMGPNGVRMLCPGFIYDSDCSVPMIIKEEEKPKKDLTESEVKKWLEDMQPKSKKTPVSDIQIELVEEGESVGKSPFEIDDIPVKVASVSTAEETTVIQNSVSTAEIPVDGKVPTLVADTVIPVDPVVIEEEKKPKKKSSRAHSRKRKD